MKRLILLAASMLGLVFLLPSAPAYAPPVPNGAFTVTCNWSHSTNDDPIVFFNQDNGSPHRHDFFGNTSTYEGSRYGNMHVGDPAWTTCTTNDKDTASYWQPSLRDGAGNFLTPTKNGPYYRIPGNYVTANGDPAEVTIEAHPPKAKIVAGDPMLPPDLNKIWFTCNVSQEPKHSTPDFACPAPLPGDPTPHLVAHINLPPCWDGRAPSNTGADFGAGNTDPKFSYLVNQVCPAPFTHILTDIGIVIHWGNVTNCSGSGANAIGPCTVDMGAWLHADFFNAWDQTELQGLVDLCINENVNCGDTPP
jgi:hypothetical protein